MTIKFVLNIFSKGAPKPKNQLWKTGMIQFIKLSSSYSFLLSIDIRHLTSISSTFFAQSPKILKEKKIYEKVNA